MTLISSSEVTCKRIQFAGSITDTTQGTVHIKVVLADHISFKNVNYKTYLEIFSGTVEQGAGRAEGGWGL